MIYVDDAQIGWRGQKWCHLVSYADDEEELHAFAAGIGPRREWFQDTRLPHYDVTTAKRARALEAGAKAVTALEMGHVIRAKNTRRRERENGATT